MRLIHVVAVSSLVAGVSLAQTAPTAGTITAVPSSARLDDDGDGQPDAARPVQNDGFCGLFVKANRNGFPNSFA